MKSIRAFAPATIANFNVGFDVLGLALHTIGDEVELTFNGTEENRITDIKNGDSIPKEASKNCCSVVIQKMQTHLNHFKGVDIQITKGYAAGSGLGSSSASSSAAAFAFNALMGNPFTLKELVVFASEGERIACGSAHVDNVAPSILGGIVLSTGNKPQDIIELPILDHLYAVLLFPNIKIQTADSRDILKDQIPLKTASKQLGLMGLFVASLYEKNSVLFSKSMQDLMIEPTRSIFIPKYYDLKENALKNKALAFGISGSGPSVFAITEGVEQAKKIEFALKSVYQPLQIEFQTWISPITKNSGARLTNNSK